MNQNTSLLKILTLLTYLSASWNVHAQVPFQKEAVKLSLFNPEKVFDLLPKELVRELRDESKNSAVAVTKASQFLESAWKPQVFEIRGMVERVEPETSFRKNCQATMYQDKVRAVGHYFICSYTIDFEEAASDKVMKLDRSQRIRLTGMIQKVDFDLVTQSVTTATASGRKNETKITVARLRVQVKDAKLK